jgi:hypothetical protein
MLELLRLRVGVKEPVGVSQLFLPNDADDVDPVVRFLQGGQVGLNSGAALAGCLVQGDHAEGDLGLHPVAVASVPVAEALGYTNRLNYVSLDPPLIETFAIISRDPASLSPATQAMIKLAEEHMRMLHRQYQPT